MSARNPAKIVDAFAAAGEAAARLALREVTPATLIILQKLNNPMMQAREGGKAPKFSDIDIVRMLYVFAHPAAESLRAIADGNFDDVAMAFSDTVPMAHMPEVGAAINRLLERAFSTVLAAEKKTGSPEGSPSSPPATTAGS